MHLAQPEWLWFLAALPLLAALAMVGRARKARDWAALGQSGQPAGRRATLWLFAAVCLSLALARPRWGRSDEPPRPGGHDVVIAIDVSRSMAAMDAVPDRLGLAVESAVSLVNALGQVEGDRAAVVAFAGRGVLRCPLTRNLGAAVATLRALKPGVIQPGGTDLAAGLDAALDAFDDQDHAGGRSVVIFSDGEDLAGHAIEAAERLRARGVIVHAVAVGDPDVGHPVPSRAGTNSEPIRYRGSVVLSKRTDEPLASIARITGGAFLPLGVATTDLGRLYQTRIEPVAGALRRSALAPAPAERFQVFLMAAVGLALAACWPERPRLVARRGLVAAFALLLVGARPTENPTEVVAKGRDLYAGRHFSDALDCFQQAMRLAPGNPVPAYDAASTLYQLGRFDEAQVLYQGARPRADAALRAKIDYALGNTVLAQGDLLAAIRHYDDCLASTVPGVELDRVRRDAAINRRFAQEHAPPNPDRNPNPRSSDSPNRDRNQPPGPGQPPPGGAESSGSGNDGSGSGQPDSTKAGRRGAGGAGGAGGNGPAPPEPGSPEAQLSEALDHIREARQRRIDETTVAEDRDDRKDW